MKRGLLLSHHLRSSSISDSFYHKTTVLSLLFSLGGEIIMITNSKRQLEKKKIKLKRPVGVYWLTALCLSQGSQIKNFSDFSQPQHFLRP